MVGTGRVAIPLSVGPHRPLSVLKKMLSSGPEIGRKRKESLSTGRVVGKWPESGWKIGRKVAEKWLEEWPKKWVPSGENCSDGLGECIVEGAGVDCDLSRIHE